jgi:NAD-dependent SIR2 family protein deacetylase
MERGTIQRLANLMLDFKAAQKPTYVLVLGAGASVNSGVPMMREIIHQFVEECVPEKVSRFSGESRWLEEFYRIIKSKDWLA